MLTHYLEWFLIYNLRAAAVGVANTLVVYAGWLAFVCRRFHYFVIQTSRSPDRTKRRAPPL